MLSMKEREDVGQVRSKNSRSVWFGTAQPDVTSDRILPASSAEFLIEGHQSRLPCVRIDGEIVVLALRGEPGLRSGPALVTFRYEHPADAGWNIVVEEESHVPLLGRRVYAA